MDSDSRRPFEPVHIFELYPRGAAAKRECLRITSGWTPDHRIRIGMAMSRLLGEGMKREIAREHPDWPPRKISLEVGRLNWGWEVAPPLYGPLEEEARSRGELPGGRAEFLARWRLEPADEPIMRCGRPRRTLEEARRALDRLFSEEPCG